MNSLFLRMGRLSFYFIVLLAAASCKKDGSVDEQNENLQPVNFKISGFSTQSATFRSNARAGTKASTDYVEGYLYFWSFNGKTLEPDIAFQKYIAPSIHYTKAKDGMTDQIPNEFPSSKYAYDGYAEGNAVSIAGASEVVIKLPIAGVQKITQFGFDTGSSDTGPKDFELYYSVDEGSHYEPLALLNQFAQTGTNTPKNTYVYTLADKNITGTSLWFKFIPKAGTRAEGSDFNPNTGAWRFDNIRLVGMATSSGTGMHPVNKLHYFLFHQDKSEVVVTGSIDYEEASNLTLSLPLGKYSVCFISNSSARDLMLPDNPTLSTFYVGNTFSNATAEIFGYVGEIMVSGGMESQIELQRLFSQVKLEFTDVVDLSVITRIAVSQAHEPLYFAPFNTAMTNPVLDQSEVEVEADFNANRQLVFNQFMGIHAGDALLKYQVTLYGVQGVLRTFALESTLQQNMQLLFRGNLLEQSDPSAKFQILKNLDWNGQKEKEF